MKHNETYITLFSYNHTNRFQYNRVRANKKNHVCLSVPQVMIHFDNNFIRNRISADTELTHQVRTVTTSKLINRQYQ